MKCIINGVNIRAISTYLPEKVLHMKDLSDLYGESIVDQTIQATGVEEVRIASEEMTSSDMCQIAAEQLIAAESLDIDSIDGLVFASQTRDYVLPCTSIVLQKKMKLNREAVCVDLPFGCTGYIHGLLQAASWIGSGVCERVLLLAGDTSSKIINPNDRALRMVFGDAGSATIVEKGEGQIAFNIQTDGSYADRVIMPAGGFRNPRNEETSKLIWDEDHNGRTQEDMYMDGMAVLTAALQHLHRNVFSLLDYINWKAEDVDFYALHQASKFTIDRVRKKLNADDSHAPVNLRLYGNTGPTTIPLVLTDYCHDKVMKLNRTIMLAIGVGLAWGSVACDLSHTHIYKPINK